MRWDTAKANGLPTTNDQGQTMLQNISESASAFTMAIGGGNDWKVSRHWAVRTSFDYVPSFKYGITLRNVAAAIGPVFVFGSRETLPSAAACSQSNP
jgi:opacity protein-like surface antigen